MMGAPLLSAVNGAFLPDSIRDAQRLIMMSGITVPLVLFGITEKKWMIFGIVFTALCMIAYDYMPRSEEFIIQMDHPGLDPTVVLLIGAFVSFIIFISTYIYLQKLNLSAEEKLKSLLDKSQKQQHKIELQNEQLEHHNRELSIRALSAQMNPHFLYNSLNSIQHFLTINDKTSSLNYLSKFGKLIRKFVDYTDKGFIPLSDELALLNHYLELENLRFGAAFKYQVEVDEDLLLYNTEVPLLLIQTHVENAILHGLMQKEGEREVRIVFRKKENFLLCEIEDNGIGRERSKLINMKKTGYHVSKGIQNSQKRLKLMYPELDNLLIIDDLYNKQCEPNGTTVTIKIPFETI